jgi:hypothetical protein
MAGKFDLLSVGAHLDTAMFRRCILRLALRFDLPALRVSDRRGALSFLEARIIARDANARHGLCEKEADPTVGFGSIGKLRIPLVEVIVTHPFAVTLAIKNNGISLPL